MCDTLPGALCTVTHLISRVGVVVCTHRMGNGGGNLRDELELQPWQHSLGLCSFNHPAALPVRKPHGDEQRLGGKVKLKEEPLRC